MIANKSIFTLPYKVLVLAFKQEKGKKMREEKQIAKVQTQLTLLWCLKIGEFLGTINQQKLIHQLNLKPIFLRRWLLGKMVVPSTIIYQVKQLAYAPPRSRKCRKLRMTACGEQNLASLKVRCEWKIRFFDEMNKRAKYKFCKKLKRII